MSTVVTTSSHGPGRTCLAFSRDGSIAYTGGSDCIVRVWDTTLGASQEPDAASEAEDAITSIATADDCWLSSSIDTKVRQYAKHKTEFVGLVANTSGLLVECVSIDPKGSKVVITARDSLVRMVELKDTQNVIILKGHSNGVRRASWHPSGASFTTCGSDGKIIVWDIAGDKPYLQMIIEGILPSVIDVDPAYVHDCSVLWHPSGQYFFTTSRSHEIVCISGKTWTKLSTFINDSPSGDVTAIALSENGLYLASATDSDIFIWSTESKQLLFRKLRVAASTVTQLVFSPTQNLLAWTDIDGNFSRWSRPIPDNFVDPVQYRSSDSSASESDKILFGHDAMHTDGFDDVGMVDLVENWIVDETNGRSIDGGRVGKGEIAKEMVGFTKAQPPFQPGCTPMENKKRYLAYNMVGVIEITDQDTHHVVNVEFHDQSVRNGYHFTDHFKYDMGYLGDYGAAFACQPENERPAHVLYKPHGAWTSHGEWTYHLRGNTRVLGVVAAGKSVTRSLHQTSDDLRNHGSVVIATSEGDLTFLSGSGRERRIMGLGTEYVTMIAGPAWVFVVHRMGPTLADGSQNLSFSLINYCDFTVRQSGPLPLAKGHNLKWIGITNEGAPATYDTAGLLHILTKVNIPMGATWARIMDTKLLERRQGKHESYWPVGIAGSTFMCLILKGRQQHPGFPKPLIQELPIRLPFRCKAEIIAYEEPIQRELMLLELLRDLGDEQMTNDIAKREIAVDKELIRLIQMACKNDNVPRAIEVTRLLHHSASFDMAVKVADFYHLVGLSEKIELLKADREAEERRTIARERGRSVNTDLSPRDTLVDSSVGTKPFSDSGQPPAILRPALARALPHAEGTRHPVIPAELTYLNSAFANSPASDGKRKRAGNEQSIVEECPKRQAVDASDSSTPTPTPACSNPLARKLEAKNPFSRKVETNKVPQKSKGDSDKTRPPGNGREGTLNEAGKQATLELMLGQTPDSSHHTDRHNATNSILE